MTESGTGLTQALSDRYEIEAELGRGGMATVYLAADVKHGRKVAVKVLRPELSLAADRFLREIRVTAGLQHPGIVPLFDSGEAGGFVYYVMPYVEGESLRDRLERDKRLPLDEALAIARNVAAVLAYAHGQGVVHRDIKPENILLSRGQALVADFGIARAVSEAGDARMTVTGHSLGTPAYMSPEQALGESEIDGRSDIYSLGCVIYEMLTGQPPFVAATLQAMIARRLAEPPPPLPSVPAAVAAAVRRSLSTQPVDRFATAAELAQALVLSAAAKADERASIVVLPLRNMAPDPENEYFADGLTEEIISDLSRIPDLRVISRTSAMRYRESDKDLPTIARELGVQYVLEGGVRRAGGAIRVTAQLIEAESDAQRWSGKFGGSIEDVFEIQERLSREIVEALKVNLSPEVHDRLSQRREKDPVAWDLCLRVRHEIWKVSPEGVARARALIDNADDLVQESALLLATRANVLFQTINMGIEIDDALTAEAEALARRALAMDPECAQAHAVMAWILGSRGEVRDSLPYIERARELDPSDGEILLLAIFLPAFTGTGDIAALEQLAEDVIARDPLSAVNHWLLCMVALMQGRYESALGAMRQALKLDPSPPFVFFTGMMLAEMGRSEEATELLEPLIRSGADEMTWSGLCAMMWHALRGEADAMRDRITDDLLAWARPDMQYTWHMAQLFAMIGDVDAAMDWLEKSVEIGFGNYAFLAHHDRLLDPIRGDARFAGLLERVKASAARTVAVPTE